MIKNLPTKQETWVLYLGWEDPLEKEMATHSSILAWEIPWTEESDSPWGHKELDTTECTHMRAHTHTHTRLYGPQKYLKPKISTICPFTDKVCSPLF